MSTQVVVQPPGLEKKSQTNHPKKLMSTQVVVRPPGPEKEVKQTEIPRNIKKYVVTPQVWKMNVNHERPQNTHIQ